MKIIVDEHMRRLVDLFTVFIFLLSVISNCVTGDRVTLDPIATAFDESDSANESDSAKTKESEVLLADNPSGDINELILLQEISSPIDADMKFITFLSAVVPIVRLKQPTVLRL